MSDHTRARCYEIPSWALAKYVKPVTKVKESVDEFFGRHTSAWASRVAKTIEVGYVATVLGKRW